MGGINYGPNAAFVREYTIKLMSSSFPNMATVEVGSTSLTEPLGDATTVHWTYPDNAAFIREYTIKLLISSFPNMATVEIRRFVNGLYESRNDPSGFEDKIRDFLEQAKEFSAQDNIELYAEEAAAQREECQRVIEDMISNRMDWD